MIRELSIKNYKSILDHTIELGRINVFIGENGCGKTNILEAVAMAAAALTDKLSVEELFNRGMRVAKPSVMRSSFPGASSEEIVLRCVFDGGESGEVRAIDLPIIGQEEPTVKWSEGGQQDFAEGRLVLMLEALLNKNPDLAKAEHIDDRQLRLMNAYKDRVNWGQPLWDFAIYTVSALSLRGHQTVSRRMPLGIYGETLDYAISTLEPETWADILDRARCISWLDDIVVDPSDKLKLEGHKLGQSQSTLYFYDKFMEEKNNVFSAENVNEGILHILFYLTLFASEETPKIFGIDNIETALNPQLCRDLMAQLPALAEKHGKQALITTHNPAILDGLNLHDDDQRLFVVSRDDEGHTRTRRIKVKPEVKDAKYKLSELWMRGHLGGLPEKF